MDLKAIILDFDGVILESNGIKDEAFRHVFAAYPEKIGEIMAYHQRIGGLIRFDKFRHIAAQILHIPYDERVEQELGAQFSAHVLSAIRTCPFVPGAEDFLQFFNARLPLYLVSVNPPEDLAEVLKMHGLTKYFKKVYATPHKKEAIAEILNLEQVPAGAVVFIGDTHTDEQAASAAGVPFIGRNSGYFKDHEKFLVFKNMEEIKEYLCHAKSLR